MFSKRNKLMNDQRKGEKITRYGIKKYSFGAASVAVAFGIYFANGPVVTAQEVSNATSTETSIEAPAAATSETATPEAPVAESQATEASASQSSEAEPAAPAASQEDKANQASQETDKKAEEAATPAAKVESPAEADKPVRRTPGYAVKPVPKPSTASMPRASNQGQPIPQGTGFRDRGATGITPGSGPAGADDATSVPRVPKPALSESEKKDSTQLAKQITWLDFSDAASLKNLDAQGGFKVGTVFKKEISPGYVVTLTVTELKPFNSTEIYKKRVEGTPSAGTYDPNAVNSYLKGYKDYGKTPPSVTGRPQNKFSTIGGQGFDTQGRKTQIILPDDAVNWGIKFKVEATYRGNPVKPTVVMADGEDANPAEYGIFTTNGEGWEYVGEWMKGPRAKGPYTVMTDDMVKAFDKSRKDGLLILKDKSVDWNKYLSPDTVTGGLGSQVFGPIISASKAVPVVMTRGASEVGFYVATGGQQALMMGFLVVDSSDAPASYGEAYHTIGTRDSIANTPINQPYLGSTAADIDADSESDWTADDREDVADEGPAQLLTADQLSKTNDLLDLNKAKNGTYTLKIKANPNGNAKAYVKAWVDFNNNGKFDDNEGSVVKEITANGDHTLSFNAIPGLTGGLVDQIGMRVRIATNAGDIEKPTGTAFSGEVEDLQVNLTYPPKGEKKETKGLRDQQQQTSLRFTPRGFSKDDENVRATIDTNKAPVVLDNAGTVLSPDAEGWYTTAEGRYKVTPNGDNVDVVFVPKAGYVGTTSGINIRRFDSNGASTEWTAKNNSEPVVNQPLNSMDARYIPKVLDFTEHLSTDAQGLPQVKDILFTDGNPANTPVQPSASNPATFLDADGNPVSGTSIPATSGGKEVGTFSLDPATGRVTFTPNKSFVGTVDPVNLQVNDANGNEHRATYQPTVTRVVPTGQNASSEGIQGAEQSGNLVFTPGDSRVPIDEAVAPTFDNGKSTKEVPGVGTYTVDNTGRVTFQPLPGYTGRPNPETVKRVDKNGTEVTATYQADVKAATPTGQDTQTTGLQGQLQTSQLNFVPGQATVNNQTQTVPLNPAGPQFVVDGQVQQGNTLAVSDASGKLQGTYTVKPNGEISFQPAPDFYGTPTPARLRVTDSNGSTADAVYQPNVTQVTPTSTNAESNGVQGQPQKGTPTFKPGDPAVPIDMDRPMTFEDGKTTKSVPGVGDYSINPDGSISFTPDKQYVGTPAPVTVKRVDKNGTPVTATYTPTVTRVTPTSTNAVSTGIQGQPQKGTPTFTEGNPLVPLDDDQPMTFEDGQRTKKVPNVGEYSINPDGSITFTPEKQYVGTPDPVTVRRVDKNGTPVTATYTPAVTKVTPTSTNAESNGIQGKPQKGTPTFTAGDPLVPLDDSKPMTFEDGSSTKKVPNVGTYVIESDGTITFTPDKQYVGTPEPVTVKRVDKNGTEVTATYTPTVTKVTPTSTDDTSEGVQGQPQKGTPTFSPGNPEVPIDLDSPMTFEGGQPTKTVQGVGVYTINPDGSITFTPDKQYVGTPDPVVVKRVDKNGTEVTAKYTPTVTKVTPTSTNAESSGIQGQPQKGTPTFTEGNPLVPIDDSKPMTFEDGSSTKTVPNVGVYTINPDGSITFTPEKQFVGTPDPVTVKRVDKNGTEVTATYTPTVTKVTPTSTPATSEGVQGIPQSGTPVFTPGNPAVPMDDTVPMTFEDGSSTKTVPNVGVYTINPDGSITFTPDKQFVGTPDPVTVKRVDKNGTPVTATYTPTVTKVTPTSTPATSTGVQGIPQSGSPVFTPGDPAVPIDLDSPMTFEDGSSTKSVPGVGVYTINSDGSITFTPEKQFVGTPDPVTVKRVDKNGTPVTADYTPTVTKVTPTSTNAESTGAQGLPQSGSPVFTPGDPAVPMDDSLPMTFEDGSSTKSVPGVGEYAINPDGSITFTPEKQFVGTPAPVTVKRVDKNGTPVTATYTPTVTKVTPTSTPATSTGAQGYKQSGKPVFTPGASVVPMDDSVPMTFEDGTTTKSVIGEGVYTIQADGSIEFVPEKTFTGQGSPLTVKRVDKNGTPVTATYQATVIPVKPGANNDYSSGVVNQAQTGQVKFVPGSANVDGTEQSVDLVPGSLKFVVNGQAVADTTIPALDQAGNQVGTYSLAQDGTVTFTPNPGYVGQPVPARVQATDVNGTTAEATYSPVVNASVTSEGMKGQSQSKLPDFKGQVDTKVPAYLEGGVTSVTVPGQGTYTVNPETGEVTFTPEPDFIGQASPITVIRRDVNGKELKIQYIPTVYGQVKTQDTTSTGYPGEKQTGTPVFEGDVDLTIPATFENGQTELTVPGEGTYVLNPDGSVTFTPEAGFLGQASGVTVVRVDRNGRKVTAQYVPTVVPVPVAPSEPEVQRQGLLPATGEASDYSFFSGVALTILASVGLVATRKRQATDED